MQIENVEELDVKIFHCCSINMKNFLVENGISYINVTQKFNKRKDKYVDCWNFIETEKLNILRTEWKERKENGNLYYAPKRGE